jgi:hypothetical protein
MSLYKILFETPENKLKVGLIGMIIITIMLAGVFNYEAGAISVVDLDQIQDVTLIGGGQNKELVRGVKQVTESGYVNEFSTEDVVETIEDEMLTEVSCVLEWTDEPSSYFQGTNEPDALKVSIIAPLGDMVAESDLSFNSPVSASIKLPDYKEKGFKDDYLGEWRFVVEAGDCGDDYSRLGFRSTPDNGNAWNLAIDIISMKEKPAEE